jgi:tRNA threonylcarbamoyl adenosine modification protein YeaZ
VLLAIDTSAGTSVAVVDRDAGVLAERSSADTRGHAEIIGAFIRECLDEAGAAVTALSGVAVGMGPGPFTGLRVGIAAARAFAFGAGKPVVPVVSHDAIAFGLVAPTLVVTDARRREVYWSAFDGSDAEGLPVRAHGPALCTPADLAGAVPGFDGYARLDAAVVSAASLGLLAESLYAHRRPFAGSEALYLRSPDATVGSGPKRVS